MGLAYVRDRGNRQAGGEPGERKVRGAAGRGSHLHIKDVEENKENTTSENNVAIDIRRAYEGTYRV